MISSKKKNKTAVYRRLMGMTQSDVAKILKTGKSNIANMESEKHFPSESYQKLLKLTPGELTSPILPAGKILRKQNVTELCIGPSAEETPYRTAHHSNVSEILYEATASQHNTEKTLEIAGEFNGTDIYMWTSEKAFPSLDIEKGSRIPVIPHISYNDGDIILYRRTLTKFGIAKVTDGGTRLLSVEENESDPDICTVDIIGEIIIK